jgi:hypothetical protein
MLLLRVPSFLPKAVRLGGTRLQQALVRFLGIYLPVYCDSLPDEAVHAEWHQ